MQESPADSPEVLPATVSDDVHVLILAAEHGSLVANRGMLMNEIFSRTGTFLTTLSAAAVAIALVAQATDFGENFRVFSLLVLPVVLLLGSLTFFRLNHLLEADFWLVVGMNHLRRAYLDIAPDLERYFITSAFEDVPGFIHSTAAYGRPVPMVVTPGRILTSSAAIVGILDSVLVGIIVALMVNLVDDRSATYVTAGVIAGSVAAVVVTGVIPHRDIARATREYQPR
jgi:hypothetical protein